MRTILLAGTCSLALSGCIPAAAGLALSAASLVTGGSGGKGGEGFTNPIDRQTTGRQIRQALSGLDDQVDPACQAILDEHYKTHGSLTAGKTVQSAVPAAPAQAAAQPAEEAAKPDADTSGAAAPDAAQPIKAPLGPDAAPAPGQCEHRFVCLPGTPKPTVMLMCPGKGDGADGTEKTMAGGAPDPARADGQTVPAGASPVVDTALSSDSTAPAAAEPAPRTIQSGGVADWNWSFDPSKRR